MHGSNFDNMSRLLAFQDAIAATPCHTRDVQELGAIDHVVVCTNVNVCPTSLIM